MNINVRILKSTADYDVNYTYIVPPELVSRIDVGVFVRVPFGKGNREDVGVVTETNVKYDGKYKLKEILGIEESVFPLDGDYLKLADMMAERYACNVTDAYRIMQSPIKLENVKTKIIRLAVDDTTLDEIINTDVLKKINQINILKALSGEETKSLELEELLRITDARPATVSTLEKKGYISVETRQETVPAKLDTEGETTELKKPFALNADQESAYNAVMSLINADKFGEFLLHGITGSGKTEVYLHLIGELLKKDCGSILLVPEIALTAQMIKRVTERFGNQVVVLHSRLTASQKTRGHMLLREGKAKIAMGVRSCVFAPVKNLKMIIVDEEQEPSYKSFELLPFYNAADVAAMRMRILNGVVVYGSATPRISSFYRAKRGEIGYKYLENRATKSELPQVSVVDMKKEIADGNLSPISRKLRDELAKNLENGEQSIIFVPRRGFSGRLVCLGCGKTLGCPHCNIAVSYHKGANRVVCHYCGQTVITPATCPSCGSSSLSPKTFGTEMVEEELLRLFPGAGVLRMDTDTTRTRLGHAEILEKFERDNVPFLVGTQMIAKGLDFPNVTLVGVVGADSLTSIPEFDASERAFVLLTQVFGRAGRAAGKVGRGVLQTLDVEDELYANVISQNYFDFYEREIIYRETLDFPPFSSMCTAETAGKNDKETFDKLVAARGVLVKMAASLNFDDVQIFNVNRSRIPKINDKYYWEFTVKSKDREKLAELMGKFRQKTMINCDISE